MRGVSDTPATEQSIQMFAMEMSGGPVAKGNIYMTYLQLMTIKHTIMFNISTNRPDLYYLIPCEGI